MALGVFLTSDLHLGMKFAGYTGAVQAALGEARFSCLERVVSAANAARADLLVVAGDLFESTAALPRDVRRAASALAGFRGTLVAVMPGNHDYIAPEDALWQWFRDASGDAMLLLDSPRPFPLAPFGLDACLYPGPCTAKHAARNAIGWVAGASKDPGVRHHIGIAHGSLEGFSPDMEGSFYPMRPSELEGAGVGLWLLGHTHARFPAQPGASSRIFCAGTPEPDGFACTHEGAAWMITIDDAGGVAARSVPTGRFRFTDEEAQVRSGADLEQLVRRWAGPAAATTVLRLRLAGRAPRDVVASVPDLRERLAGALLSLDLRADELRPEIGAAEIDAEYPAGSYPHALLSTLAEERDQDALELAWEMLKEMRT